MNNQQNSKMALSVVSTLAAGIAVIYILIAYPHLIFAVAGVSAIFLICAYLLTQNIINFINMKNKSLNVQIKTGMDDLSSQIEGMSSAQAQLGKATYLYTRQAAENVATLRGNYAESQEALHKNLSVLANAQNKSTKLLIKYDQSNTTKLISTLKDIRNNINETMSQGFDRIQQPDNADVVAILESIVEYLKSQPAGMDQSLGVQINNVAHELQNISSNIARVQSVPMQTTPMGVSVQPMGIQQPVYQEMPHITQTSSSTVPMQNTAVNDTVPSDTSDTQKEPTTGETVITETADAPVQEEASVTETAVTQEAVTEDTAVTETPTISETAMTETVVTEDNPVSEATEVPESVSVTPVSDDPNKQLSADEIAALFAAAEPAPKKEEPAPAPEPVEVTPVSDDPNKQLSADEIAALFAAAESTPTEEIADEPSPEESASEEFTPTFTVVGKEESPKSVAAGSAPTSEPVTEDIPVSDDPNKQLSADEIAALFAAAEPAPKKEEPAPTPEPVAVTPVSDDPNKQLSPDEIAALFASIG